MILEIVTIQIKAGQEAAFELASKEAANLIMSAQGYISHELRRCLETKGKYVYLVRWQTVDDHMVGFRESERFQQYRALVSPYYETPSQMNHYEAVT